MTLKKECSENRQNNFKNTLRNYLLITKENKQILHKRIGLPVLPTAKTLPIRLSMPTKAIGQCIIKSLKGTKVLRPKNSLNHKEGRPWKIKTRFLHFKEIDGHPMKFRCMKKMRN